MNFFNRLALFFKRHSKALVVISTCSAGSLALAQESTPFDGTVYVAEVPEVGTLTLNLQKQYAGKRNATMLWLFEDVRFQWEFKDGKILLYRQAGFHPQESDDLAFILTPRPDGSLQFSQGGILKGEMGTFFTPLVWLPAKDHNSKEARLLFLARDREQTFKKGGELKQLPLSYPPLFMDVTAWLFRDREHESFAILKYPRISTDILEIVGEGLLINGAKGSSFFVLPILGAHPNISDSLREKLFALPNEPAIWRSVACNPSSPKRFYVEYLKRIREGDQNIRHGVARDQSAPREAWELALAPIEPEVLGEFSRNKSADPDLLEKISENMSPGDVCGLAGNPATPPAVLAKLAANPDKQILWALTRNPSASPETVEKVLRTLATNPGANVRDTSVDDPRLPQDLIPILAKDPSIQVRLVLAMNKAVPVSILEDMARDPYRMVSERARDNIEENYPEVFEARKAAWIPLEQLNPNNDLIQDLDDAIKAGDVAKAGQIIASTSDPDLQPRYANVIPMILAKNFEPFKELLKTTILEGGGGAVETMFLSSDLKPLHVEWMIKENLLDPKMALRLMIHATEYRREDLLQKCKTLGLIKSLSEPEKAIGLFIATASRHMPLVEFWLAEGARGDQPVRDGVSATDLAAKAYSIDILKRLDSGGKYKDLLAELTKEFPPEPKSPLLGFWSNKRDGFYTFAFQLGADGTGYMGASVVSFPILWKIEGQDLMSFVIIGPQGLNRESRVLLKYDPQKDILNADKSMDIGKLSSGGDPSPFYRVAPPKTDE